MAHLHLHTNHSVIDGRGLIEDYIKLAQDDHQEAIAVTDHGTMGGVINSYLACKKKGIKFVAGIELYVDVAELRERNYPGHLTVLAKNEDGYRALIAANNLAHRQFYYRPRITLQQIIEGGFAKDWIILSGCQSSPLYQRSHEEAVQIIKTLADNAGGFFLEFMRHKSSNDEFEDKQWEYLEKMAAFHRATGLPMVITNDCHFAHAHSESIHTELMHISHEPSELEFDGEGFHFKTASEMQAICNDLGIPNGWDNAVEIGKLCDLHIPEADTTNWYVPDVTNGRPKERLIELTRPKVELLGQEYKDRYYLELSVLSTSPAILNSYLVTFDIVSWCRARGIPVAARGSMGGSLVSWLLDITTEDPVKYNLSFARAVNPARPTIPDFDLDVSSLRRPEILEYLQERYENNIPIAAYTHYGPKGALRKVLRMEGLRDYPSINDAVKPLPDDWTGDDFDYSASQHRYVGHAAWTELVPEQYRDFVALYQGLFSTMSAHPCGILIGGSERPLEHEIPMQWIASSKQLVSAYDMYTLKKLGLFKLDVLGMRTYDQLKMMEILSGETIPDDNYDERQVLQSFGRIYEGQFQEGLLAEVFQMDGYACREVIRQIGGIRSFEDIVAANTLARPGCAQFTQYYRSGFEGLVREYPPIASILEMTNGLILYQEQVMEIARVLADFDDAEQDDVKEAIKYFRHEVWSQTIEPKFRERCEAKGFNADNILSAIAQMASYTYNRAHALTYSAIAYKMMWYKIYHPSAYYAAVYDGADDKMRLILESQFFGVKWIPADVNRSKSYTTIDGNEILLGLEAIKSVGPSICSAIVDNQPYTSLEDFQERAITEVANGKKRKINKNVIANMTAAFAFQTLGHPGTYVGFKEAFGFPYQFLDVELVQKLTEWHGQNLIAGFITDIREFKVRKDGPLKGKEMCMLTVANIGGSCKCVIFPEIWKKAKGTLYAGAAVKFDGSFQATGDFIVEHGYAV